ncbi:alpha/beta hydrolase [Nocardia sp. NBC_00508]|uniref:alpha/beta hydrolase n=1 Tax=Nocardia sp. NBC_00508 TaxID=2975992 RepID=UPI002E80870B|nr:alpha/beta hydrolase [Nocardia sp. NBC_00508]WUD68261.1 alpha/beta hydrolase [Nocardia sp. NBC_00508]
MTDERATDVAAPGRSEGPRRVGRIGLLTLAAALAAYLALSQLLVVVPVAWVMPLLRNAITQSAVLLLGAVRDAMGSWNVVSAVVAAGLSLVALRSNAGHRRAAGAVAVVAAVGLVLSVATSAALVCAARDAAGAWIPFAPAVPFSTTGDAPDETVTYATVDGQPIQADLYLPTPGSAPAPLVVSIHGGAFVGGSRGTNAYTTWLADNGYAVLDVDYRLSGVADHRWNTADADVACALTWAATNAQRYNLDLHRLAAFGNSAGGNLAINVANKINAGVLRPSCGSAAELPRVGAVIALYPAVDLTAFGTETAVGADAARQYLGGTPEQHPDRYAATDSAPHITGKSPPTLLIQGANDHLVLAEHTAAYAAALDAAGIPQRYVELPFLDHAFGTTELDTGAQVTRHLTRTWLEEYLP